MDGLDANSNEYGNPLKIPHTIKNVNLKNIFIGGKYIRETLWYIGDTGWDSIMVNPGYFDNTVSQSTDGYYIGNPNSQQDATDKLLTPRGRIGVGVNGVLIYNFSNLEGDKNAVTELKGDNYGGKGDSIYSYHYHQW